MLLGEAPLRQPEATKGHDLERDLPGGVIDQPGSGNVDFEARNEEPHRQMSRE